MKKLVCLLFVSIAASYGAEVSFAEKLNFEMGAGRVINQFDKDYTFGPPAGAANISIEGKDGWFLKLMLNRELNDYFAIGIESGYIEYDLDFVVNPVEDTGVSGGLSTMKFIPVLGSVRAQYPIEKYTSFSMRKFTFVPYAIFGIGTILTDCDEDNYAASNGYAVTTGSSTFTTKYGAGLDFSISENVAVNLEGSYLDVDVKTRITHNSFGNTENVKNDSWLIGGALKYSF